MGDKITDLSVWKERGEDFKRWRSLAFLLSPANTPHASRHAMGRHLIKKTGNIVAVQRQLGQTNAAYSIQYARVTDQELADALDDR